jgi:hypothetical protein
MTRLGAVTHSPRWFSALLVASALAASPAGADDLYSPTFSIADDIFLGCSILYTGKKSERKVTIELLDRDANLAKDVVFATSTVTLTPGQRAAFVATSCPGGDCRTPYCRFQVDGKATDYRGAACVEDAVNNLRVTIGCLAAQ